MGFTYIQAIVKVLVLQRFGTFGKKKKKKLKGLVSLVIPSFLKNQQNTKGNQK